MWFLFIEKSYKRTFPWNVLCLFLIFFEMRWFRGVGSKRLNCYFAKFFWENDLSKVMVKVYFFVFLNGVFTGHRFISGQFHSVFRQLQPSKFFVVSFAVKLICLMTLASYLGQAFYIFPTMFNSLTKTSVNESVSYNIGTIIDLLWTTRDT